MFPALILAACVGSLQGLAIPPVSVNTPSTSMICPIPRCLPAPCLNPRTHYAVFDGVKCPMCQECDEPIQVECPVYNCFVLDCVKTRTEYTVINGIRCPKCPVCVIELSWHQEELEIQDVN